MVKQARLRRIHRDPIYKFGIRVPRDSCEARVLEQKEGHTKWGDAEKVEIKQLFNYKTFKDLGLVLELLKIISKSNVILFMT